MFKTNTWREDLYTRFKIISTSCGNESKSDLVFDVEPVVSSFGGSFDVFVHYAALIFAPADVFVPRDHLLKAAMKFVLGMSEDIGDAHRFVDDFSHFISLHYMLFAGGALYIVISGILIISAIWHLAVDPPENTVEEAPRIVVTTTKAEPKSQSVVGDTKTDSKVASKAGTVSGESKPVSKNKSKEGGVEGRTGRENEKSGVSGTGVTGTDTRDLEGGASADRQNAGGDNSSTKTVSKSEKKKERAKKREEKPRLPHNWSKRTRCINVCLVLIMLLICCLLAIGAVLLVAFEMVKTRPGNYRELIDEEIKNAYADIEAIYCNVKFYTENEHNNLYDQLKVVYKDQTADIGALIERDTLKMFPCDDMPKLSELISFYIADAESDVPRLLDQAMSYVKQDEAELGADIVALFQKEIDMKKTYFHRLDELQNIISPALLNFEANITNIISTEKSTNPTILNSSRTVIPAVADLTSNFLSHKLHFELFNLQKPKELYTLSYSDLLFYFACGPMGLLLIACFLTLILFKCVKNVHVLFSCSVMMLLFVLIPAGIATAILMMIGPYQLTLNFLEAKLPDVIHSTFNMSGQYFDTINKTTIDACFTPVMMQNGEMKKCLYSELFRDSLEIFYDNELLRPLNAMRARVEATPPTAQYINSMDALLKIAETADFNYHTAYTAMSRPDYIVECTHNVIDRSDRVSSLTYDSVLCPSGIESKKVDDRIPTAIKNVIYKLDELQERVAPTNGSPLFKSVISTMKHRRLETAEAVKMLKPIFDHVDKIKKSTSQALDLEFQLPKVYYNIMHIIGDEFKSIYLLVATQCAAALGLILISFAIVLIAYHRIINPYVDFEFSRDKGKRFFVLDKHVRYCNGVCIFLEQMANDPRMIYEEFENAFSKVSPDGIQPDNVYPPNPNIKKFLAAQKKNRLPPNTQPILNSSFVDVGWMGGHLFNGSWIVPGQGNSYIVTPSPTEKTAIDIWHLVFQHKCKALVTFCDYEKEKAFQYWNKDKELTFKNIHCKYRVKMQNESTSRVSGMKQYVFMITDGITEHYVELLHYPNWIGQSVAESGDLAEIMRILYEDCGKSEGNVLVQCPDGVSRSVALVGIDMLVSIINESEKGVPDPFALIKRMREARANCYTNSWQFYATYVAYFEFALMNNVYSRTSKFYTYLMEKRKEYATRLKESRELDSDESIKKKKAKVEESVRKFMDFKPDKTEEAKMKHERNLSGQRVKGRKHLFMVCELIGSGTYGRVYAAYKEIVKWGPVKREDDSDPPPEFFALKTEKRGINTSTLLMEIAVLHEITAHRADRRTQIVAAIDKGHTDEFAFLVMTIVGKSLAVIKKAYPSMNSFSAMYYNIQAFSAIQQLHKCGFIHRDIKPGNFAIGLNSMQKLVHILDFGMARKVVDENGKIVPRTGKEKGFVGTLRYASRAAHELNEQNMMDDIESWLYMAIEMFTKLSWSGCVDRPKVHEAKKHLMTGLICDELEKSGVPTTFRLLIKEITEAPAGIEPNHMKLMSIIATTDMSVEEDVCWPVGDAINAPMDPNATRDTTVDKKAALASFR